MTYNNSPAATTAGQTGSPPICKNCLTSTTPLWRRDEIGSVLCNACGLYLKLHDRPRPISLKTDVIKSRNRVKSSGQAPKKKSLFENDGLTPVRADASNPDHVTPDYRRASQKSTGAASDGSNSPLSRTGTPSLLNNHNGSNNITNGNGSSNHNHNIAPQSMFDNASLHEHSYTPSAAFPAIQLNQPSPGSSSSVPDRHLEPPQTYEGLMAANTALKTRVSELEVINDLFRGRVAELEQSEASARRAEAARAESEDYIKKALNDTQARESALKRRLDDLEKELEEVRHLERSPKRMRVSDMVAQSAISKPQTATA